LAGEFRGLFDDEERDRAVKSLATVIDRRYRKELRKRRLPSRRVNK
jgi:hypothetical protein